MNPITFRYAFVDEAGGVAISRKNHVLIVAALCMENPRPIENIITKAQKKYGTSLASGELKAKKSEQQLIKHVLDVLAQEKIEIYSIIIDRRILGKALQDPEDIYRWAVTRLIRKMVARYPRIEITLDRRYTKEGLRYKLEKFIREGVSETPQQYLLIRQEDSQPVRGLQAVDFISWAIYQNFEHENDEYYRQVAPRIVDEEFVTKEIWDKDWK